MGLTTHQADDFITLMNKTLWLHTSSVGHSQRMKRTGKKSYLKLYLVDFVLLGTDTAVQKRFVYFRIKQISKYIDAIRHQGSHHRMEIEGGNKRTESCRVRLKSNSIKFKKKTLKKKLPSSILWQGLEGITSVVLTSTLRVQILVFKLYSPPTEIMVLRKMADFKAEARKVQGEARTSYCAREEDSAQSRTRQKDKGGSRRGFLFINSGMTWAFKDVRSEL